MSNKFRISDKVEGFYFIIDSNDNKVGLRGKDNILRVKRFKTRGAASRFIKKMEYALAVKGKEEV